MKKLANWLFSLWYAKQLKQIKDLPFKMKIETDSLKSNCILEIENHVELIWLSIKGLLYKLGIKSIQNLRARIHRDEFGKQAICNNPVFAENEVADIKSKYWLYITIITGFCIAESFLYLLTASLFVPGGGLLLQLPVAIFLAVLVMLSLNYAFEKHFQYREVMERYSKKELTDIELHKYSDMRNIGYVIILLCFGAIIFSGLARIFYLEYIPARGLSPERVLSVTRASKMASIFTMLITIITALFMAMIKKDQTKISNRFRVYRTWHNAHVKRNDYTQSLIQSANRIILVTEQCFEKHWQLVIDLKRIYKMDTEYDEKYEALHQEYVQLKAKPGFRVTDDIYGKFSVIQCVYEEIFRYGVLNAKEIKDKIDFANEILKVPEGYLAEHLEAMAMQKKDETILTHVLPATNGKAKEHEFSIH